jgi:hypothetical protein
MRANSGGAAAVPRLGVNGIEPAIGAAAAEMLLTIREARCD